MNLLHLLLVVPLANTPGIVNPSDVDALWEFVQTLAGPKDPPPFVYFTSEEEPPTSTPFLAFYYEHTRVVRMSPLAVHLGLYDANAAGYRPHLGPTGYVYLVLGHEMLHYTLADRVPMEKHHCLFVHEGYRQRIAEFLVRNGMAHPSLLFLQEPTGCEE